MSNSRLDLRRHVLLTTGQVAAYCGVDRVTVLRWINKRVLKSLVTPGGQHRIRLEDFKLFLQSQGWDVLLDEDK
jgi:excisionase family DNA binding protein